MTDTSTADLNTDQQYFPQPPPSPLQQVAQSSPQDAGQKAQDRLPGGNVPWTTRPTQGFSSGPPQPPPPPPMPTPRPPEAPVATAPVTSPKPPPENQRFTPNSPRPPDQFGKPNWAISGLKHYPGLELSTFLPNEQEAPGVMRGAGKQLAQFGPPSVAGPARAASDLAAIVGPFLDFYSHNAFSQHYRSTMLGETQQQEAQVRMQQAKMRMQTEQMQVLHDQMMENGAQAIANHSALLTRYGDIINKHNNHTISDEAFTEAIHNLNIESGHSSLDATLQNGGPTAVINQLQWEDQRLRDFWSSYTVLDQAQQRRKKETGDQSDDWVDGGGSNSPARQSLIMDEDKPTQQASADQSVPTADGATSTLDKIKKQNNLNDQGMNAAQDIVEQGDVPGMTKAEGAKLHPQAYRAATTAAGQIGHAIGQVASGAGTPEEKIEAIRNINPNVAQTLDDLANYRQELKDVPNATRGQISSWAHQVNPKYDPTKAAQLKEFYKAGSKENTAMQAAANLPNVMIQLYSNLRKQENTNYFGTKLDQALKGLSQDPEYNLIANQLRVVQQAITAIQSGTGVPRVTILEEMMKAVPATASSETIRGAMMQDLAEAWGRIGNIQGQFSNFGVKGYAPGLSKETVDLYSGFLRSNWRSGEFPSDVPPQLKQLSRDPAKARTGLSKTEREPPATEAEARGAKIFYDRNKDNPDPAIQAQIQHAMRTMGLTPNPPWELHVNE